MIMQLGFLFSSDLFLKFSFITRLHVCFLLVPSFFHGTLSLTLSFSLYTTSKMSLQQADPCFEDSSFMVLGSLFYFA